MTLRNQNPSDNRGEGSAMGKTVRKPVRSAKGRSAKELARLAAIRERFQREKPSLESLKSSDEYDVVRQGDYFDLVRALSELKKARERKNLSLAEVARRSGIDKAALSRLENGLNANP